APKQPAAELLKWADADEHLQQRLLLARKQLPDKVLESLIFSSHADIQREAVSRKALTPDEMLGFAKTGDEALKARMAALKNLIDPAQLELATSASLATRQILAANPFLCDDAALLLARSKDGGLRLALAGNHGLSQPVVMHLAGLGEPSLGKVLASRPELAPETVAVLLEQGDDAVAYHLAWHGHCGRQLANATLRHLADHVLPTIRALAARSRPMPIAIMAKLGRDQSPVVRRELARNPETVQSILENLVEDEDQDTAAAAAANLAQRQPAEPPQPPAAEAAAAEPSPPGKPSLLRRLIGKVTGET
ncbi:MAG: hypothetical protein PHC30_01575, partial [Lentisphaeria bacterium]|nr:hypothetical protein [Lentisphaeria bacterium]